MGQGRKNTRDAVNARRVQVARLHLQGCTQEEIAARLGPEHRVSRRQIGDDIAAIRKSWLESTRGDYNELIHRELASIAEVERNAWEGWNRSCQDAVSVKHTTEGDVIIRTETTTRSQAGDAQMLGRLIDCCKRRCELLGLNAPVKVAETDKHGNDLPPDQRRLHLLDALNAARGNEEN